VVGERGHVFAFEPLKGEREKLEKLVELNGLYNVTVIPKALGDKNTKVSMEGITIKEEGKGEIECITLDSWVEETKLPHLDFLKMDVEGYERKVLLGGMRTLQHFKPKMGICIYHLPDDPEILRELILQIDPEYEIQYNKTRKKYVVGERELNKITILTPSYNDAPFIARMIESVITNEYENWELIILNDASTDDTEERIQLF